MQFQTLGHIISHSESKACPLLNFFNQLAAAFSNHRSYCDLLGLAAQESILLLDSDNQYIFN